MSPRPELCVYNHQKVIALPMELVGRLESSGRRAIPAVLKVVRTSGAVLADLAEVEVSLVDDETIAEVHMRFMNVPGATDVITFDHGEIHVSVETARRQAREFGSGFERELMLYIIHGLLHLAGYEDATDGGRSSMDDLQQTILAEVW